jgi:hypothetical protein
VPAVIQLKWFRIETGADGSILSCTEVEAKGRSGGVVRFYEAIDADKACKSAQDWFASRQRSWKKRYENNKASGMCGCGCGGPARTGKTTCQAQVDRTTRLAKERKAGRPRMNIRHATAEDALRASLDDLARHDKARGGSSGARLRANLVRFDALGPIAFRAWLVSEINKRSDAAHQIPTEEAQAAE